jgi:hypothetical protein
MTLRFITTADPAIPVRLPGWFAEDSRTGKRSGPFQTQELAASECDRLEAHLQHVTCPAGAPGADLTDLLVDECLTCGTFVAIGDSTAWTVEGDRETLRTEAHDRGDCSSCTRTTHRRLHA